MSRVVHVDATVAGVTELCEKHSIPISVIEPLQGVGTRVVLNNSADADAVRARLKGKLIEGPVVRSPLYAWRSAAPFS